MRCKFVKPIFQNKENGYCIFVYHTMDTGIPAQARSQYYKGEGIQFTAVGNNLPDTDSIEIDLQGKWIKNGYGTQLKVENYKEILPQTEEGIIGYLSSGIIKGIGPKTAKQIVDKYGVRTFDILDNYPQSLLTIRGITERKLEIILASYQGSHAIRDLAAYLTPFNVTPKKIHKIYEHFGETALEIVKSRPFSLCQINGFGFLTVDEIAKANRCRLNDSLRIEGCILYCMEMALQEGHLYQEKGILEKKSYQLLNHGYKQEVVSKKEIQQEICRLVDEGSFFAEDDALYLSKYYGFECEAAVRMAELLVQDEVSVINLDKLITEAQQELGLFLSPKQEEGVKKAFTHLVSMITGGPGTGKTTVQRVLLYINEKLAGGHALLTAPTGRASRRMAESTGRTDAVTMHSAMGLTRDEEQKSTKEMFSEKFIIADEFTMADMRLSYEFFSHIQKGTRLVLVGDMNQLPSVGPGNVFRELILCGVIPVTILDTVFRQAENSRIAINAERMQNNNTRLDFGAGFHLIEVENDEEASEKVVEMYQLAVSAFGKDKVQILTPFRKRGEASVEALNLKIWNMVNPSTEDKQEIKVGKKSFRVGDRIIQTKNKDVISNGDIGYVEEICTDGDGNQLVRLLFSDYRKVEYSSEEMEIVDHAYATTVHKSQGSEYPMVILPWLPMFYKMLRRNILYTAITRAKVQVVIVGNKKAIDIAIRNTECDKRNTRLGRRIRKEYFHLLKSQEISKEEAGGQMVFNLKNVS